MKWVVVTQGVRPARGKSHLPQAAPAGQPGTPRAPQAWADAAGGHEDAGRVLEPRHMESRGQEARLSGPEAKADGVQGPEGRRPGCDTARMQDTPPGAESGACRHRGDAGPGESPWSPWGIAGVGVPPGEGQTPGVARRTPRTRAVCKPGTRSPRRAPR